MFKLIVGFFFLISDLKIFKISFEMFFFSPIILILIIFFFNNSFKKSLCLFLIKLYIIFDEALLLFSEEKA